MNIGYDAKRIFHNTTGLGNYSRDLVRILATFYPDNHYFLYNPKPAKVNRLTITDNMSVRQPEGFFSRLLPALWRSKRITNDLKKDKIDIYHGLSAELPSGIDKVPVKSVVTVHDLIFVHYPQLYKPIDRKIYFKKFLHAVQVADQVVAISEQTKRDIIRFARIPEEKIEVIYQGCHKVFKKQHNNDTVEKVLQKYRLPHNFLLNVGTLEPRKNALTIVKAIQPTSYRLVLVGRPTAYAQQIKDFVVQNNMTDRVYFLQGLSLDELAVLYRQADAFIYPSIYEGFGIPIIEALYSKTPVITNAKGVFPEAAGPYSFYLNDVTDVDEMRQSIKKLMQSDVSDAVEKSYRFVQRYNDEKIAENWINLYRKIIQNK